MRNLLLVLGFLLFFSDAWADKTITIFCSPNQATIYRVLANNSEVALGTGTAVLKIDKDEPIKIVVRLDGYKPLVRTYVNSKSVTLPKEDRLVLEDRLVRVNAQPHDARIFINGVDQSTNSGWVEVKKDASITVEVKKAGYFTKAKTYHNRQGMDIPPINESIALTDRSMFVKTVPADVQVVINGKKVSEGNTEIVIPMDACVTIEYVKDGYVTVEKQYCAKEGQPGPPITESISLKDRQVALRTTPEDASIKVDGRVMGKGEYKVRVPFNQCVEVIVEKAGFVISKKSYCNEDGVQPPPIAEHLILPQDEAFISSVQSDQANINFTIETSKPEADAWKVLSQITMNYFDNIELADKETGYIRTSWNLKNFLNNTIRTRIIVKQADIMPLKYSIKLVSEYSGEAKTSVKEDESYLPWDRILNTYKDVISEFQSRLK
ncbi:hypothetical protein [Daejeonella lutea]|uniref:PEGA domain-containing protein n=1 Tax=Daejeonella lutea TaxID=572036 RepID=A0A1T5ENA4_9SPHI|nr:hypothetical protein [Daejeonella lutea]SKB85451.1 hypothetical protein SAMN05661099_3075 [Daejeonella lutea]